MKLEAFGTLAILAIAVAGVQGKASSKVVLSQPDKNENLLDVNSALRMFLEAFQRIMPCGYPAMNIPVLAPYNLPYYKFNITTENIQVQGHIANLLIGGLNKFRVLGNSYNATSGRFYYDMMYPEIQILAEETVREKFSIAGIPIDFEFDGLLNMKFQDIRSINEFSIVPTVNGTLQMIIHEMNFYVGGIKSSGWNKKWDIAFNNFMNRWFADTMMTFSEQIQPLLKPMYTQYALGYANWGLSQITMAELTDMYASLAAQWDAANCQLSGSLF